MVKGYFHGADPPGARRPLLTISAAIGIILAMSVTGIWGGKYEGFDAVSTRPSISARIHIGIILHVGDRHLGVEGMMDLIWLLAKDAFWSAIFRR